jgi:hypothetical protein
MQRTVTLVFMGIKSAVVDLTAAVLFSRVITEIS